MYFYMEGFSVVIECFTSNLIPRRTKKAAMLQGNIVLPYPFAVAKLTITRVDVIATIDLTP